MSRKQQSESGNMKEGCFDVLQTFVDPSVTVVTVRLSSDLQGQTKHTDSLSIKQPETKSHWFKLCLKFQFKFNVIKYFCVFKRKKDLDYKHWSVSKVLKGLCCCDRKRKRSEGRTDSRGQESCTPGQVT